MKDDFLSKAMKNQEKAFQIIEQSKVIDCWQSVGATVNLIGSLKTGLLMKHRDIDFHIYTQKPDIAQSFKAISLLATHPNVVNISYTNLLQEEDACLEWHAYWRDDEQQIWQIDMIHMASGSRWDGYFENMADRIAKKISKEQKETVLKLKYLTPDDEKIAGIEYYMAVMRDGIKTYEQFLQWRKQNLSSGIIEWLP